MTFIWRSCVRHEAWCGAESESPLTVPHVRSGVDEPKETSMKSLIAAFVLATGFALAGSSPSLSSPATAGAKGLGATESLVTQVRRRCHVRCHHHRHSRRHCRRHC